MVEEKQADTEEAPQKKKGFHDETQQLFSSFGEHVTNLSN